MYSIILAGMKPIACGGKNKEIQMSDQTQTRSLVVFKQGDAPPQREIRQMQLEPLPADRVRVEVKFSSLNYKDALCATGHPGVARTLPLVPGIDAAGTVIQSNDEAVPVGQQVMIIHARFGTQVNGGYSSIVDVPGEFIYRLPSGLTLRNAMILGTAGFTAAQCVDELIQHGVQANTGPVVVTGATGGVGIMAVKLLSKLGYQVVASTGKSDWHQRLLQLGASEVLDRSAVNDSSDTPLLKGQWAGAVDTVGGNTLATIIRMTKPHGCVTACGLVAGVDLPLTVYPFILRGITLQGIDSATISSQYRYQLWQKLATDWQLDGLDELATEVTLDELDPQIDAILNGAVAGRVIVNLAN